MTQKFKPPVACNKRNRLWYQKNKAKKKGEKNNLGGACFLQIVELV